jgi:prepilin-type N-terminal cleavage/methylation domain-containing protein
VTTRRHKRALQHGFTLIEMMVVVAVVGALAAVSVQSSAAYVSRARRAEAIITLSAIADAQAGFRADHDYYASTFDELGVSFDGTTRLNATQFEANDYTFSLSRPWGALSYYCSAVGNIDGDPWPDVVIVEEGSPMRW